MQSYALSLVRWLYHFHIILNLIVIIIFSGHHFCYLCGVSYTVSYLCYSPACRCGMFDFLHGPPGLPGGRLELVSLMLFDFLIVLITAGLVFWICCRLLSEFTLLL
jgi:hypothetical protein